MSDLATTPAAWVEAIGWALVHSTWQGMAVAAALALRGLRRGSAEARYLAACLALALMVALPVATARLPASAPAVEVGHPDSRDVAGPAVAVAGPSPPARAAGSRLGDRARPILPALVAGWLVGVGVLSGRLLGGYLLAGRRKARDARPVAGDWPDRLDRLKARLGVRRVVALLETARLEVPTVIGWARPAILVPTSALTGLAPAELEAILAHELAHVARHDYLINLCQCAAETLLFYHPGARWASSVIRREREHCCDDLAVAASGDRLGYARALATMEGLRGPALSLSPAANGGSLLARVRRVLEPTETSMSMKPARLLVTMAVALTVAPAWLARVAAQQPPRPAPIPPMIAAPERVSVPVGSREPFAYRSHADIVTDVDEGPTGRLMFEAAAVEQGFGLEGDPRVILKGDVRAIPSKPAGEEIGPAPASRSFVYQGPKPAAAAVLHEPARRDGGTRIVDADCATCLDPPDEAEIWAKVPTVARGNPPLYEVERKNVRILTEKIGDQVDPVKVYPLAGPCQLVHCRYKCSVYFDESYRADYPIPFNHRKARVEVVFIEKDHLRRAPKPPQAPGEDVERKLRLQRVRELEQRRNIQKRELDLLNKELDELERELKAKPGPVGGLIPPPFNFAIGAFW